MNYYDVLEVSPKASDPVLRAAYKSLMQRYHPDKNPDLAQATEQAARIAQAYEVLSNPDQRAAYDLQLRALAPGHGGAGAAAAMASARAAGRGRAVVAQGQPWYVWGLLVFIAVMGALLWALSKKAPSAGPTPLPALVGGQAKGVGAGLPDQGGAAGMALAASAAVANPSDADAQARTIVSFATNLSIDLAPGPLESAGAAHVLTIAQLGFRVMAPEPTRWVQKIEAQREALIRLLLIRLAKAHYTDLAGPEGERYLLQLIASTVCEGVGLQTLVLLPTGPATVPGGLESVQVLMAQSFALR